MVVVREEVSREGSETGTGDKQSVVRQLKSGANEKGSIKNRMNGGGFQRCSRKVNVHHHFRLHVVTHSTVIRHLRHRDIAVGVAARRACASTRPSPTGGGVGSAGTFNLAEKAHATQHSGFAVQYDIIAIVVRVIVDGVNVVVSNKLRGERYRTPRKEKTGVTTPKEPARGTDDAKGCTSTENPNQTQKQPPQTTHLGTVALDYRLRHRNLACWCRCGEQYGLLAHLYNVGAVATRGRAAAHMGARHAARFVVAWRVAHR